MDSVFLANKLYKDGYQFDGYEVVELVDGYQIGSKIMSTGDAARLVRNLRKVDYILEKANEVPQPILIRSPSSPQAKLYTAIRERSLLSGEANRARLAELRPRYAAVYEAICAAADGYK